MDPAPGRAWQYEHVCSLPGHELWSDAIVDLVSDAAGDERAGVSGSGLGADVGRNDVASADPACPPYPPAQLHASARSLHPAFRNRLCRDLMALGGVLLAIELAVKLFAPQSYLPAAGMVLI